VSYRVGAFDRFTSAAQLTDFRGSQTDETGQDEQPQSTMTACESIEWSYDWQPGARPVEFESVEPGPVLMWSTKAPPSLAQGESQVIVSNLVGRGK
jgi:hypothetical protein